MEETEVGGPAADSSCKCKQPRVDIKLRWNAATLLSRLNQPQHVRNLCTILFSNNIMFVYILLYIYSAVKVIFHNQSVCVFFFLSGYLRALFVCFFTVWAGRGRVNCCYLRHNLTQLFTNSRRVILFIVKPRMTRRPNVNRSSHHHPYTEPYENSPLQ